MIQSRLAFLVIISFVPVFAGLAQYPPGVKDAQKKPVLSISANTVLVDVIARDGKGKHIRDLRPGEFGIFQDGVKQEIDSIEIYTEGESRVIPIPGKSVRPAAVPAPASQVVAGTAAAPRRINIITFLMDFSSTEFTNQKYVRDGAIKYVKEKIGAGDVVAIYATGIGDLRPVQPFTMDKVRLLERLGKADLSGSSHKGELDSLSGEIALADRSAGKPSTLAGGADYVPGAPLAGDGGPTGPLGAAMARRLEASLTVMRSSFTDARIARPVLAAIKSIAFAQRDIPGRKTLVLVSEGFALSSGVEETMREAVDAANKSNLAIYSLDVKGLKGKEGSMRGELASVDAGASKNQNALPAAGLSGKRSGSSSGETLFDKARQAGSDQEESVLRFIANSTGGFIIHNTNDFAGGFARIDDDFRTYYLLSYRPANQEFDGKFRKLTVEVSRPGVKVRARNGYYAVSPNDSLLTPEQRSLFSNARQSRPAPTLALYAAAHAFFPDGRLPAAVVTVEVSADAFSLKENGAISEGSMQVIGLVSDKSGRAITTFGGLQPIRVGKDAQELMSGGFISHSERVSLYPGNYTVELLVNEPGSGHYGYCSKQVSLDRPPDFAVGDVILGHQIAKATPEVKSAPLVVEGAVVIPTATRRFRNGERLIFYFDLYNAMGKEGMSDVEVTLALAKDGKPLQAKLPGFKITLSVKAGVGRLQAAKFLELAGLAAGSYSLKITARDQISGRTSSSEAGFTVVD
jgi:VWFA-related protein